MKHIFNHAITVFIAFLLSACVTNQISHYQLSHLNKNMSRLEVNKKFEKPPTASADVSVNGRNFLFDRYPMNNGVQIDWYFLAFEADRLVYWGYASEFRKLNDDTLAKAIDEGMRLTQPPLK